MSLCEYKIKANEKFESAKLQDNKSSYFDYVKTVFFAQLIEIIVAMRKHKRQQMTILFCWLLLLFSIFHSLVVFLQYFLFILNLCLQQWYEIILDKIATMAHDNSVSVVM